MPPVNANTPTNLWKQFKSKYSAGVPKNVKPNFRWDDAVRYSGIAVVPVIFLFRISLSLGSRVLFLSRCRLPSAARRKEGRKRIVCQGARAAADERQELRGWQAGERWNENTMLSRLYFCSLSSRSGLRAARVKNFSRQRVELACISRLSFCLPLPRARYFSSSRGALDLEKCGKRRSARACEAATSPRPRFSPD